MRSLKDINIYRVDATDEASKIGMAKVFNMIVLGAYVKLKELVKMDDVVEGLKKSLPKRYHHMIPDNEKAIHRGMEILQEIQKV